MYVTASALRKNSILGTILEKMIPLLIAQKAVDDATVEWYSDIRHQQLTIDKESIAYIVASKKTLMLVTKQIPSCS